MGEMGWNVYGNLKGPLTATPTSNSMLFPSGIAPAGTSTVILCPLITIQPIMVTFHNFIVKKGHMQTNTD